MLEKIKDGPSLVSTNIVLPNGQKSSKIQSHAIKELSYEGQILRIGILGILGPDGCLVSKAGREEISFIGFNDQNSKAEWDNLTDELDKQAQKLKDKTDIIILVMHAGHPEDERLANSLKNIDFIIAGHTHRVYSEEVNGVPISQAGDFGSHIGAINLSYDIKLKKLKVLTSKEKWHQKISNEMPSDLEYLKRIEEYKRLAKKSFPDSIQDFDKVIYTPTQSLIRSRTINNELGTFITSSIRSSLNKISNEEIDLYFTSMGLIRSSFYASIPYNFADIFEFLSIGYDQQGNPGPEVSVFKLTPNDVSTVVSFMELYSNFSNSFAPAFSDSLEFKVRKYGIPFINRIYDIKLAGKPLKEYSRNIIVATNMIVAKNVDMVAKKTFGLIDIQPLDLNNQPSAPKTTVYPKEYELFTQYLIENKN